jgi:hypothetical protein
MKSCFENDSPSPDESGNPFEKNGYFFLHWQSDQRKLLLGLRKKQFLKKIATNSWIELLKNSLFSWVDKIEVLF